MKKLKYKNTKREYEQGKIIVETFRQHDIEVSIEDAIRAWADYMAFIREVFWLELPDNKDELIDMLDEFLEEAK